jgi:hypothetical protein
MLTALIGSGSAVLVGGVAWILCKERGHLPGQHTAAIALALAIVLMLFAGDLACHLGIGGWIISTIHDIEGFVGPAGKVILALCGLWLLVKVIKALWHWKSHRDESVLWTALMFPILSAAINSGIFLSINQQLAPPANAVQAAIRAKLGA